MQQAVCVRKTNRKKNTKKSPPPKTHHDIESSPSTATASRQRVTKRYPLIARFHISRVCANRPRTALAMGENDDCYTYTDRHTDGKTNRQTYRLIK